MGIPLNEYVDETTFQKLLRIIPDTDEWFRIYLQVIRYTGVRPCEACRLKLQDLCLENDYIIPAIAKKRSRLNKSVRVIPEDLKKNLSAYIKKYAYCFVDGQIFKRPNSKRPYTNVTTCSKKFRYYAGEYDRIYKVKHLTLPKQNGVEARTGSPFGERICYFQYSLYSVGRKSCITQYINKYGIEKAQKYFNHVRPETTMMYYQKDLSREKTKINSLFKLTMMEKIKLVLFH